MTLTIGVCITTFGDADVWDPLAERALASVLRQTRPPDTIVRHHGPSLHEARNEAAARADVDWLCFLDADDELDERYLEAMATVTEHLDSLALVQPATLGVHPDGREDPYPVLIPPRPLLDANYLVIGTLIRADQFHRVGGFRELSLYEDWDLWIRAWLDGATITVCPEAIYRVHVSGDGRNNPPRDRQVAAYNEIRQRYLRSSRKAHR